MLRLSSVTRESSSFSGLGVRGMRQDEYCAEVYRVIRENFRANDVSGGMTAAAAAYVVQQALSVSHEAFGFERFKDVLAFIEKQGLIRTGPNAKQAFALWLTESPATPTAALRVGNRPPPPFRRLRNPIWLAFVATSPGGRRFLNRVTHARFMAASGLSRRTGRRPARH